MLIQPYSKGGFSMQSTKLNSKFSTSISMLKAIVFGLLFFTYSAQAFSVKVHIFLANQIRNSLIENSNFHPDHRTTKIKLILPSYMPSRFVELSYEDAFAIYEEPLYFRGGAIGPDNTAFSGLTDPSHAPEFKPFSQCEVLYRLAVSNPRKIERRRERAYALGCFLHGITDNVAHHIVNYFSHQTFTLNPIMVPSLNGNEIRLKPNQSLRTSFFNVINHITTETMIEKSFSEQFVDLYPNEFTPEKMNHKIAFALYKEAYLKPNSSFYVMHHMRKVFEDKKALLDSLRISPKEILSVDLSKMNREQLENFKETKLNPYFKALPKVIAHYLNFYKDLAPYEKVLALPVLLEDMKVVLDVVEKRGEYRLAKCRTYQGYRVVTQALKLCYSVEHIYAKDSLGKSVFDRALDTKKLEIDSIIEAYLKMLENLSNTLVSKDITSLGEEDALRITKPMLAAIEKVTEFPVHVLPMHMRIPTEALDELTQVFTHIREALSRAIKDHLIANVKEVLGSIQTEYARLASFIHSKIDDRLQYIKEEFVKTLSASRRPEDTNILNQIQDRRNEMSNVISNFPKSVAYMNAFNSIVAVLANRGTVLDLNQKIDFSTALNFSGPASYDASFMLEYNQVALCPEYREQLYPCGISSLDMLQPGGYEQCVDRKLNHPAANPPIECFAGAYDSFSNNPDAHTCTKQNFDIIKKLALNAEPVLGSYSLAFPPSKLPASLAPKCRENYRLKIEVL